MSNQEQQNQLQQQPEWQFCHSVYYNGSLNGRLMGQRMSIAIKPTAAKNTFLVSHSILSKSDNFSKRVGRTICMNRILKHLDFMNTRIDYPETGQYVIRDPEKTNRTIMTIRQYPYADIVHVSEDIDSREQMDMIALMFSEGAYFY
jgi:hypothetical protein